MQWAITTHVAQEQEQTVGVRKDGHRVEQHVERELPVRFVERNIDLNNHLNDLYQDAYLAKLDGRDLTLQEPVFVG